MLPYPKVSFIVRCHPAGSENHLGSWAGPGHEGTTRVTSLRVGG